MSLGQSVDGFVDNSETARQAFSGYLSGEKSLPDDLRTVLTGTSAEDLKDLGLAAFLGRLTVGADDETKEKVRRLANHAKALGLDDLGR